METIQRLDKQGEVVEKRIKVLEMKVDELKQMAITKNKAGDKRGALMAMKNMKMYENELTKLDGQSMMLEQQKMMIQSANFDAGVINSLASGNKAINQLNKQMDVADLDELKDQIEDNMAEINERQEFFADVANEDADDLMDELNELEADAAAKELEAMDLDSVQPIASKP